MAGATVDPLTAMFRRWRGDIESVPFPSLADLLAITPADTPDHDRALAWLLSLEPMRPAEPEVVSGD